MAEVLNAIKDRFSTRGYKDIDLTDDELNAIINAGLQAPTAANKQELHFTVVKKGNAAMDELDADLKAGADKPGNFYYDAPVVIFISGEDAFPFTPIDAGIAVENMALAAEGLGLGNVIIGCVKMVFDTEKGAKYEKAFGFPEGYKYQIAIAVGHKDAVKEPHTYEYDNLVTVL